ncbi:MAG TPA: Ku protein [Planctomycetota bacterium]|nr:Ku protein [Planctomycetota bacterium]
MPRSMWSGSISFALVNIPVKLFTAVSPKDVHFHQVHDADGVRIQQKRICPADGKEVPYEHIVKGYEVSPNRYVIIKPEELEALNPKASHTIEIETFTKLDEIDPLFYENSYYLAPDKGATKPYALLTRAMEETGQVAIARAVIRTKQYLCALRPIENALTMSTLYYADEVVSRSALEGLPSADVKLNEKELAMAKQLIESLSTKFEPKKYHDEYRERVLEMIEQKAKGEEVVIQPVSEEAPKVVNLMAALEQSLAAARRQTAATGDTQHRPAAKARAQATRTRAHGATTGRAHAHRKKRTA